MSPFVTWFSDNLGIILVGGFLVATLALLWGCLATWCPPCRAEMADLDRLQGAYSEEGLVVLHVSDEDRETLLAWIEDEPASTLQAYAQPIPWPETGRPRPT